MGPVPSIGHSGSIAPFATQSILMGGMPPRTPVLLVLGISNTDGNGAPLSIDLSSVPDMSPGCTLNTSVEVQLWFQSDLNGEVVFSFPLKPAFGQSLNFQFGFYESLAPNSIAISPALNLTHVMAATPSPPSLVFETTYLGGVAGPNRLLLTNTTPNGVTVDSLLVFDGEASDFTALALDTLPKLLGPGGTLDVDVTFSPSFPGPRAARLQIGHSGLHPAFPEPEVELSGLGLGSPGEELLIDVGSPGLYRDGGGAFWLAGFGFTGGHIGGTQDAMAGTPDPVLYQTWLEGLALNFALPLPPALYELTAHYVEPVHQASGLRLQDLTVEGSLAEDDLDVYALAGHDVALTRTYQVDLLDGELNLAFSGDTGQALLTALEIRSLFPVAELSPEMHDFGSLALGASDSVGFVLSNTGTDTLELSSLVFHTHMGAGADFELDLGGMQYVGSTSSAPHTQLSVPASFSLPPGQSAPGTLSFSPSAHGGYELMLEFMGNFDLVILSAVGNGGSQGHPYLHVVIEPTGETVDWDGNGSQTVTLDGSFSHTHEPGHSLVSYTWMEGPTLLSTSAVADVSFPVGEHTLCLTIADDNLPAEELTDCVTFSVSPVTAIPGVLAHHHSTGATAPATLLDGALGTPAFTEALTAVRVEAGGEGVGGSTLSTNVISQLLASVDVDSAGSYEFSATGGVDNRLWIDGSPYVGPLALGVGSHALEVRFALNTTADLPGEVLFGPSGGSLDPIDPGTLSLDATMSPPIINAMTDQGSTLGGNTVVIDGYGFFPPDQVTVHWGGQDFTEQDFVTWTSTEIVLLSPAHAAGAVPVTVETPAGTSGAKTFTYNAGGPPPISFNLSTVATVLRPTCATWGPDGRLYVGRRFGQITALTFDDDYNVTAQVDYAGVAALSSHEILGITTHPWDPPSPVRLYVAHSELYAQGGGPFTQYAPYPGQVSVLEGPAFNVATPVITGLPTSNHDHAVNGLVFDNNGDLLMAMGSNTNAGVAIAAFGGMDESPLSASVLKARTSKPGFNGAVTYVETLGGAPNDDQGDGALVDVAPGVHVGVHAPGLRNPFDLVYTTRGRLYCADNGPNTTFGPASTGPLTQTGGDASSPDEFMLVEQGSYYGHPNRNRGRTDARQNIYSNTTTPSIPGVFTQNLTQLSSSQNGIDEYRATAFQSQLRGDLLVQRWNGVATRLELSDDGRSLTASTPVVPTTSALGLLMGPRGTVVLLDFSGNAIKVLQPSDVSVTGMVAWDVFPWRAPASGGTPFVIGGHGFGPLGSTSVTFDGAPATINAVTPGRIEGTLPAAPSIHTDLVDIVVSSGGSQSVLTAGFRWLMVPVGSEPGSWEALSNLPAGLGEVTAGVINGKLYVIGEGNGNTYRYDIAAKTWSTVASRSFAGHHTAGEVYGGKWYLFGGIGGSSAGKLQIYDPVANTWSAGAAMPWLASSSSTAVIGDKIYIAGGMVSGAFTVGTTVAYDPLLDTYTPLADMPLPRNHAAAGTDGTRLWVFGGRGPGSGDSNVVANGFAQVQVYDPLTNSWESSDDIGSSLLPLPIGRGGTGKAVYKDGEFYVFGGETVSGPGAVAGNVYDRTDVYDPAADSWRTDAPMALPRHGSFPVLYESRIFLPGGGVVAGASTSSGFDVFNRQ